MIVLEPLKLLNRITEHCFRNIDPESFDFVHIPLKLSEKKIDTGAITLRKSDSPIYVMVSLINNIKEVNELLG